MKAVDIEREIDKRGVWLAENRDRVDVVHCEIERLTADYIAAYKREHNGVAPTKIPGDSRIARFLNHWL